MRRLRTIDPKSAQHWPAMPPEVAKVIDRCNVKDEGLYRLPHGQWLIVWYSDMRGRLEFSRATPLDAVEWLRKHGCELHAALTAMPVR